MSTLDLTLTFETSGGTRTGRYDETLRVTEAFAARYGARVRRCVFGQTPRGRPLVALVVGSITDAAAAHRARRPVLFFQGGIHPGEIEGKDAGFLFLRDLLDGKVLPGARALDHVTIVFVPVLNVDGHERFGRWNRPNQAGPEEMGWRTTARNLNLNRDYMKVDAPEMAAVLAFVNPYDPIAFVDMHATDGSRHRHDLSLLIDAAEVGDGPLRECGVALRDTLVRKLAAQGHDPVTFYPELRVADRPEGGFALEVVSPRHSNGYWGVLRQRLSLLVETHSWCDYAQRTRACYDVLHAITEQASTDGARWLDAAAQADDEMSRLAGKSVDLAWEARGPSRVIDFKGYAYERTLSPASGALRIRYDLEKPAIWQVPYLDQLQAVQTVTAPVGGYIVPPEWKDAVEPRLVAHGLRYRRIERALASLDVEAHRARDARVSPATFEGRTMLTLRERGEWAPEKRSIDAGALYVPVAQPRARLLLTLLEPEAADSLAAWGFFNACYERKEYLESYVAEDVAEELLRDPAVRAEFEKAMLDDPAFAASPEKRLEFFYRRHGSWDECEGLYPILRVEVDPG